MIIRRSHLRLTFRLHSYCFQSFGYRQIYLTLVSCLYCWRRARIPGTGAGAITLLYPTHQFYSGDAGLFVFAGVDFRASKAANA